MPVRTAGALVFLLLMIEQHNTFSFWNGYQINPKICQNILYSHCFMSQNTCFSFLNSGTAHHFLFLSKEQHTTFSFCQRNSTPLSLSAKIMDGPSLISHLKMDLHISGFIFLRFKFIIYGKLPFEYTFGFLERIND